MPNQEKQSWNELGFSEFMEKRFHFSFFLSHNIMSMVTILTLYKRFTWKQNTIQILMLLQRIIIVKKNFFAHSS